MERIWILNLITFISAFLLFQIELIIAKMLLPNYGGSYLVWGSCIVFFQAILLLGYVYSHYVIRKFGISLCRYTHLALLFIPLFFFPGKAINVDSANNSLFLSIDIFVKLCITIGPVFCWIKKYKSILSPSITCISFMIQLGHQHFLLKLNTKLSK